MIRKVGFVAISALWTVFVYAAGFNEGAPFTWWTLGKGYDLAVRHAREEVAKANTSYAINRANLWCSSNGDLNITDFTVDGSGMVGVAISVATDVVTAGGGGVIKLTGGLPSAVQVAVMGESPCVDNSDRRL